MSTKLESPLSQASMVGPWLAMSLAILGLLFVLPVFWLGAALSLSGIVVALVSGRNFVTKTATVLAAMGLVIAVIIGLFLTPVTTEIVEDSQSGVSIPAGSVPGG